MPDATVLVEVCIESPEGAIAAAAGGAHRLELCANLLQGGSTPSAGVIDSVRESVGLDIVVLVRARAGDFLYSKHEMDVVRRDISTLKDRGVEGVATGFLNADGTIDRERTARARDWIHPLRFTFHRAFDLTRDRDEALETLVELGVDSVLSSGGAAGVSEGLTELTRLVRVSAGRLTVIPAGGVTETNIARVVRVTKARAVHFSARATTSSRMEFRNPSCSMGAATSPGEYEHMVTDKTRVAGMIRALLPVE